MEISTDFCLLKSCFTGHMGMKIQIAVNDTVKEVHNVEETDDDGYFYNIDADSIQDTSKMFSYSQP